MSAAKAAAAGLFGLYFFFAVSYAFLNIPGNAPDEPSHAAYARYWAESGELPVLGVSPYWPRYTAFHPPFYYGLLRWVHGAVEGRPLDDVFRAFRLVSVVLHGLALWCLWRVAARAFPKSEWSAAGAAAFWALSPMAAFIGASVINDALANFAAAWVVLGGLRIAQGRAGMWDMVSLGAATGLAFGSKMSAVPPAAAVWAVLIWRGSLPRGGGALAALLVCLIAGPVFWRNTMLYGDPLAAQAIYATEPLAGAGFLQLHRWAFESYQGLWARLGWNNITVPAPFYAVLWALGALAAAGAAAAVRAGKLFERRAFLLLGVVFLVAAAQGVMYGVTSVQRQGRYLFVGMAAGIPFFFWGLKYWADRLPRPGRRAAWAGLLVFALALQWVSLSRVAGFYAVIPGVYFMPKQSQAR
jgi:hypothetical protein